MARAATTSDAFNAIAEPRRRQILLYLAHDEHEVGQIVAAIGLDQPSVSKHLGVLREASTWCASAAMAATVSIAPTPRPSARCMSSLKPSNVTGSTI